MPSALTYPGVYVEEVPSGVRTIVGVPTSVTAFIGRAKRGQVDEPVAISSFGEFERLFGGLDVGFPLGYAVYDYYQNQGSKAIIVRLYHDEGIAAADAVAKTAADATSSAADAQAVADAASAAAAPFSDEPAKSSADRVATAAQVAVGAPSATPESVATAAETTAAAEGFTVAAAPDLPTGTAGADSLQLEAASPGAWGNVLKVSVDHDNLSDDVATRYGLADATKLFNITIWEDLPDGRSERFANVTWLESSRRVDRVLAQESALANVRQVPGARPEGTANDGSFAGGDDGGGLDDGDYTGSQEKKTGLYALDRADIFNLLCIPPDARAGDTSIDVYKPAMAYAASRRAMLIVDPPAAWGRAPDPRAAARDGLPTLGLTGPTSRNAAIFFPRVVKSDPKRDGQPDTFAPCGIIAGVIAGTDTQRGVWKAPAGLDAALSGIRSLEVKLSNDQNGALNPLGINCLRTFGIAGNVVWGARTLRGADLLADEYKYIPVRRLALFIEETLFRGTQWVVFEPNDEPLWASIRLNVGAFMNGLFRQGAFQGRTPREAYFVKCDSEANPQDQIDKGIVSIRVGFAPLKPAEFVVITLQQISQLEV